ncbi:endonuclease [Candidatus Bathyarchaeota archaeon]|nr:endonuclease [Candidatus Bathyarchaeota archaeon]
MSLRELVKPTVKHSKPTRTLSSKQVKAMKKRGYDAEREIVSMMRSIGFDALRVPVSAPSNEPLPDVFAIKENTIIAFEIKCQTKYAYYKRDQVIKLLDFLSIHKIYPKRLAILAAKFKYKGWSFSIVDKPNSYTLKIGEGMAFKELEKQLKN